MDCRVLLVLVVSPDPRDTMVAMAPPESRASPARKAIVVARARCVRLASRARRAMPATRECPDPRANVACPEFPARLATPATMDWPVRPAKLDPLDCRDEMDCPVCPDRKANRRS